MAVKLLRGPAPGRPKYAAWAPVTGRPRRAGLRDASATSGRCRRSPGRTAAQRTKVVSSPCVPGCQHGQRMGVSRQTDRRMSDSAGCQAAHVDVRVQFAGSCGSSTRDMTICVGAVQTTSPQVMRSTGRASTPDEPIHRAWALRLAWPGTWPSSEYSYAQSSERSSSKTVYLPSTLVPSMTTLGGGPINSGSKKLRTLLPKRSDMRPSTPPAGRCLGRVAEALVSAARGIIMALHGIRVAAVLSDPDHYWMCLRASVGKDPPKTLA
ncbi:Uncharacterised protein [Mycobacterium tuberculosis]|nr:Uncharacterised protein [Mycobacterium tuberculosis]